MTQFASANDFYAWVDRFDKDERARVALPMLLSQEIVGYGFALSCDFLKELGYISFAKPDVHIKDIFAGLELCPPRASDYQVFKAAIRVAKNVGVTPYNVDKLFWLIGSGKVYDDPSIGRIGTSKKEFIAYAQPFLKHE
jgi:thermostable 8-oxoguanine DNA glycosylase